MNDDLETRDERIHKFYECIINRKYRNANLILRKIGSFKLFHKRSVDNVFFLIIPVWIYSGTTLRQLKESCPKNLSNNIYFNDKILFWENFYKEQIEQENYEYIDKNLSGVLKCYSPKLYYYWGKNLLFKKDFITAGKYFLMSGIFSDDEEILVDTFLSQFKNSHPNQIISQLSTPFLCKNSRKKIQLKTIEKLNTINCPSWIKRIF